jgi:hypothetical protein
MEKGRFKGSGIFVCNAIVVACLQNKDFRTLSDAFGRATDQIQAAAAVTSRPPVVSDSL